MARLTQRQWQALISKFENSGLSQASFCRQQNLNPKYFSLKRKKLQSSKASITPVFSKAIVPYPGLHAPAIEVIAGKVSLRFSHAWRRIT